ncbi:MAG TPA: ATP-binding protein, partial [Thermoanaerobaculia bacterium]|nr:ATP-binding protein [Thermoanaerobaculia bacterium]
GLSPFRRFDGAYRDFLELAAGQVASAIANAEAYELERLRAESLAELDRAKTAFFSNVSHEFRTPLTLMLGPLEDILAKPEGQVLPENRELLQVMQRNGQRLLKLVNTLLDFSRIEAGRVQARFEPTDLSTFTAELVSVFRSAIDKAGMRLMIDAQPLSQPVHVDRDMWEKIVLNLVSNAFKYTLDGEIAVSVREERNSAIVTVRDTGIGVPADELPKLFNRFHRVEGARGRTQEGSGIGLALVQELVRLHGGNVSVTSAVGVGSEFEVTIPIGTVHLPEERVSAERSQVPTNIAARQFVEEALRWLPDSEEPGPTGAQPIESSRGRILLADDNADMREYVRRLLASTYDVTTVSDGLAALNAAIENPPDLVLTDVMMPHLDGFGLLRELRANRITSSIPVIMLSARAGEEARIEGLQAGADDYLVKPFSARELLARVDGMLALTRVRQEERAVLHDIFTRAPAFIATLRGPELIFEVVNAMFQTTVGEARAVIGKPITEALPEVESQGFIDLLRNVYRTGESFIGQEARVLLDRDGTGTLHEHFVNFVYQPMRDADGAITGIFVHGNDVSEQVRARQELLQAQESLKEADRRKDEFIATLSHELRTPLTAILGWSSLLRMGGNDESTMRTAIETIDASAKVQAQLIDDVLDVSRITSGKVRIASDVINIATVAASAIDTVGLAAAARGVRLTPKFEDPAALVILGDANRLQQILWNLLSNAIKFTPAGGEVRLEIRPVGQTVAIQVRDTGIGIRPDFLPHVFEAFRQAESTTTRVHGGLGLGLSIVRYLVELHGGQIMAESEGDGKGSTFTVELPRLKGPSELRLLDQLPANMADLSGMNVLVIDDQAVPRDYLEAVLRRAGASVRTAVSVQDAVRAVETELPDVILCDIAMPHEDGYAFIAWMRSVRWPRRVPVLAITAFGRPDDELRVRQAGFDGYVRKPVEPEVLAEAVASAI